MDIALFGVDQIVIDSEIVRQIGERVSITPNAPVTVSDGRGGSVTLSPGVTIGGVIVSQA